MTTAESWGLTPREFYSRAMVRESYQAMWKTEVRNAPHFHRKDDKQWTVDDFITDPAAIARKQAREAQEKKDAFEVMLLRRRLALMRKDSPPPDLPEWAVGPYRGGLATAQGRQLGG